MENAGPASVLWRRLDRPGHEAARLLRHENGWRLQGCAVFSHDASAGALTYRIDCDRLWRTRSAEVAGWVGGRDVLVNVEVTPDGHWLVDGETAPQLEGCVDIDLNFSPSTNLLPIRRLALPVGSEASVRAGWLRFPSFRMEPLEQSYRRTAEDRYLYRSAGGRFEAELEVDPNGFVVRYPGFSETES
jgi:uncharacterized protein